MTLFCFNSTMIAQANFDRTTRARLVTLPQGLYSIQITVRDPQAPDAESAVCLAVPPALGDAMNEVALAGTEPSWQRLSASGYLALADVRSPSGMLLVATRGSPETEADLFDIVVARLGQPPVQSSPSEGIPAKIKLRIERLGWRRFAGKGWARSRNRHLQILEIGLEPNTSSPFAIEVKAFAPDNRQTEWKGFGEVAGFAEAAIPLTGFAVRLAAASTGLDYGIGYSGEFKKAGTVAACFDGMTCRSPFPDDALVGVNMWLNRRGAD